MAAAAAKTTIKPYKLKPSSGDTLTRDDLATWREVLLSYMRQNEAWKQFLPDGERPIWTAYDEGELPVAWGDAREVHKDFLTCLATFSPAGCGETIKRESTSFNWVLDLIKDTYGLKTRGEHFLTLDDLKFDFSAGFTYQQAYMEVKDFICAGLLQTGDRFENKPLTANEKLSPVAKNFITKEWLMKIDPRLPKHIRETRGHLFTADKPTLACNQKTICDQISTMIAELNNKEETSLSNDSVNINFAPANRRGNRGRGIFRGAGAMMRGYSNFPQSRPVPPQIRYQVPAGCQRCLEAIPTRYDAAKTHSTKDCMFPVNNNQQRFRQRPNFRVVIVPEQDNFENPENVYFSDESTFNANFEDITLYDYDNENKDTEFYCSPSTFQSLAHKIVNFKALPIRKVQTISASINDKIGTLTIDSGSEGNCMRLDECEKLRLEIKPLDKNDKSIPTQADGKSLLNVVGQTEFVAIRGKTEFHWVGYVATELGASILCGAPFIEKNKIVQELHNNRIVVDGKVSILEDSPFRPCNPNISNVNNHDLKSIISIGKHVPKHIYESLIKIHKSHEIVFNGDLSGGYNGASGNFDVNFNFKGGIPPTPNYDTKPIYYSSQDNELLQAKIDELEEKGICIKVADTNIVPKYAAPCMLVKKHSVRDLQDGEYDQMSIKQKLKYNRFILCHNKLSEHIDKQPAKMNKLDDTVRTVGSFEYVITTDLSDSFWQRHIAEDKLPYFAFHSPSRGPYIFLRSTQGLINQSEGLEQLVSVILQDCVMAGWCRVLADNLYVMGHSYEETVNHWKLVLDLLLFNNIKLSPKKTACFPEKLDLLGWTKEGKYLIPDQHRQNVIANAPLPTTVKNLRSYLGAYRTFFRCKQNMSHILRELEEFQAGKKSSDKLLWNDQLKDKFEKSKHEIQTLDELYLPKPDDQLVMTSDWSEKGISCTLWAIIDNNPKVVTRFSAKLEKSMENCLKSKPKTLPCDGEMTAVYVGIKSPIISASIRASNKKAVCLVDNKPVVEAAKLIKNGKFSSSRVINNLMTALAEYNLEFQHLSSKMGQNLIDDYASRNPASCHDKSICKICSFIKDCDDLTIAPLSFSVSTDCIIGHVEHNNEFLQQIIRGQQSLPFNNRKALLYLQNNDSDLLQVREHLLTGKRPTARNNKVNKIKRFLNVKGLTIAKDGCLVVTKYDNFINNRELIVIPDDISVGLIYALHLNLNHPTSYQLSKILETKFFLLDKESKVKQITDSCTLCCSVSKIPKEIEDFKPNQIPDHPGNSFTIDVLKMKKKNIMVTVENFSGFLSTTFVNSEKSEDLLDGIITTTSPFRSSITANIRVDQAPGFKSLIKKNALKDLNISIELGHAKNKNSIAIVDKKMKELEDELRKLSNNNTINLKMLSKATTVVNEKVRHQGLSAKEILFSRDQFSQKNLEINDEVIAEDKMKQRLINNHYNARSKSTTKTPAKSANASKGQLVFLKNEIDKHSKRSLYIVIDNDVLSQELVIAKLPHALSNEPITFQPHNFSYKVKQTDVILSPNQPTITIQECFEEFISTEVPKVTPKNSTPYYPYEEDDEDIEFEFIDEEIDDNSSFESFSDSDADDEQSPENESDNSVRPNSSDHDSILAENLEARHHELNDLIDDEVYDQGQEEFNDDDDLNQPRPVKKGDIVTFVLNNVWVRAKVLHKFKSTFNYNVVLENGDQLNVTLNPPTPDLIESWALLSDDEWEPEQLRHQSASFHCQSPNISFIEHPNPSDANDPQPSPLNLDLQAEENIQVGKVYILPQPINQASNLVQVQLPNKSHAFQIHQDDYDKRYARIAKSLKLLPNEKHKEPGLVNFYIYNELYSAKHSSISKLKSFFQRKGGPKGGNAQ